MGLQISDSSASNKQKSKDQSEGDMKSMSIIEELRNESVKSMKTVTDSQEESKKDNEDQFEDSDGDDDSQDDGEAMESFEEVNGKIVRKSGVRLSKTMQRKSKKTINQT